MYERNINSEPLCETSEKGEKLFVKAEMEQVGIEIGKRIVEAFNYLPDSEIAFLLKTNSETVRAFTEEGQLPPTEIILGIHKITGVSIDWILTDKRMPTANVTETQRSPRKLQLIAA